MNKKQWFCFVCCGVVSLMTIFSLVNTTQAQDDGQNPTPIVIALTPENGATAVPHATGEGALLPDRFEPNNTTHSATTIGLQTLSDLTLSGDDVDLFSAYLKTGQMIRVQTAVSEGLDTQLNLYWDGQLMVANDDHSATDVGSLILFTAPADGWIVLQVEKATVYDGGYDLILSLVEPTATATPLPTETAVPTTTPLPSPTPIIPPDLAEPNDTPETAQPITPGQDNTYTLGTGDVDYFTFIAKTNSRYACETVTDQVDTLLTVLASSDVIVVNDDRAVGRVDSYLTWDMAEEQPIIIKVETRGGSFGQYQFVCQQTSPSSVHSSMPVVNSSPMTEPLTMTTAITTSGRISLTVQHVGRVPAEMTTAVTPIRLLVYYDANNDRQPGPGEGIANVSVLAVDGQGQRIARIFSNAQGEAIFNLNSETVARVIVPFVPGWSARIRAGENNNDIVLGLPAVRLPVFLPVQNQVRE